LALHANERQKISFRLLTEKIGFPNFSLLPVRRERQAPYIMFCNWRLCMHFRPLHDRVVVRRLEAEEKTSGGIIIPDTAKEKPQEGEVIAVGPGARDDSGKLIEPSVSVGDRILFGKWSGTEVKLEGEDLLIMKESDILGVIETVAELKRAA
jgi:chaperonin GroES